jgi:hypothetical protein
MKNRYTVDKFNRLVIKQRHKRFLTGGRFSIDKNNQLIYWLNEPISWRREYSLPKKIVFKGRWQLNKNYDLELVLDKTKKQFQDDILVIKGNIISTDRDTLAFETKTYDQNGLLHIRILKLSVIWFADETNRLSFIVKKQPDNILTLEGDWLINDNQQITYIYERTELKTKTRISNTLTFEGFWQISEANKLTYILKHSPDSRFDFRAQIETPNIYPQKGVIKYRLGVGIRQTKKEKIISLYGTWKFSRKLGLIFQMDYGNGRICGIEFAADVFFDKKNEVNFSLKNKIDEPLGLSVTFTHKFLKELDAEAFLRLKGSYEESRIDAGVRIPF